MRRSRNGFVVPRRQATWFVFLLAVTVQLAGAFGTLPRAAAAAKLPVILDSDIGDDIDDTWALGLLLRSPELEV